MNRPDGERPPRILGIVPARGGSKGLPGKHLLEISTGQTLLGRTLEVARDCPSIDRLILSTDDESIATHARELGADVPWLRPPDLATDGTPGFAVLVHALERCEETDGPYDLVVYLQPTSPLRTAVDIEGAIARLLASNAPTLFSVSPLEHPVSWNVHLDAEGQLQPVVIEGGDSLHGRQAQPLFHRLNGAIYIYRGEAVRTGSGGIGAGTIGYVMPTERSVDIDTEHDLAVARALLRHSSSR